MVEKYCNCIINSKTDSYRQSLRFTMVPTAAMILMNHLQYNLYIQSVTYIPNYT